MSFSGSHIPFADSVFRSYNPHNAELCLPCPLANLLLKPLRTAAGQLFTKKKEI
jgi:hypothetical protein